MRATFPAGLILLDMIILGIFVVRLPDITLE